MSKRRDSQAGKINRWHSVFALWVIGIVVVIGVSIAGSIAAIVSFRSDVETREPDSDNVMGLDQADGSQLKPWVVAADGSGSHRTIADAIEAGPEGAFIRVMSGNYEEALHVTQSITIEGPPPELSEGVMSYVCQLRNSTQTPLTIDCPDGQVMIRNFAIDGEGHQSIKEEFNAIDVVGGTLTLHSCDLQSSTFNCVKVRKGSVLDARQCRFLKCGEFAISAVDGTVFTDQCDFIYDGVQLVGGTGTIKNCKMLGSFGIYVSRSAKQVEIIDTLMEDNLEFGIASTNGGDVLVSGVTLRDSKNGIRVSVLNQENENHPPGRLRLTGGSTLEGCHTGVLVQGGIFESDGNCRIERGDYGIRTSAGTVTLRELIVSQMENSGINVSGAAELKLVGCVIDRCKGTGILVSQKSVLDLNDCTIGGCQTGIDFLAGKLTFNGGVVRDCGNAGILLGDKDSSSRRRASGNIHDVVISGVQFAGMIAYSGPVTLSEMSFDGGQVGLFAWGPPSSELSPTPLVEIDLVGARFVNQSDFGVVARGDARITVDRDVFDALFNSRRAMMSPPAKIVEAESATNSIDKESELSIPPARE